jgi:alpha-glucosidase
MLKFETYQKSNMKFKTLASLAVAFSTSISFAQTGKMYNVKSPDGRINLNVAAGETITSSVKHDETEVITPSSISITLAN